MKCNCSVSNIILGIVILVFALWASFAYSKWIVVIASVLLIIHELMHKHNHGGSGPIESRPARKKRR